MAQFIAFNPDVEVDGATVFAFLDAMKRGKENRQAILDKHNIIAKDGEWNNQEKWLQVFKEFAQEVGDMNLLLMGMALIENAKFPPMNNLQEALLSINIAYHSSHRLHGQIMFDPKTGTMLDGIGHYQLVSFDSKARKAIMNCRNPYPSKFDEGIITEIVRRFKPADAIRHEVKIDITKERRTQGADSCIFLISW
jgi:hypothetical protein